MRTLRLSLMGTVILALLGGLGSAVLAQEEDEPPGGRGPFSVLVEVVDMDEWGFELGPGYGRMYDWQMVIEAEATDPRFSGTWTLVQNVHGFGEPGTPDTFIVSTGTALLENEDGAWVGELENFSSVPRERLSLVVEGEGAYAGYTAIIDLADREWNEFKGVVFDGGLPPMPEPPAE